MLAREDRALLTGIASILTQVSPTGGSGLRRPSGSSPSVRERASLRHPAAKPQRRRARASFGHAERASTGRTPAVAARAPPRG